MRESASGLIRLAWPLMMAQASFALYGICDGYFLAQHSSSAMIASLPAGMVLTALTTLFAGTIGYTTAFITQAIGADKERDAVGFFIQGLWMSAFTAPLFLAAIPASRMIIDLCGHAPSVAAAEKSYLTICAPGGLLTLINVTLGSYFTGQGRTRYVATCFITGYLVNLVADRILILGLGSIPALGIAGAAVATVLGYLVNTIMLSVAIIRDPLYRRQANRELLHPQPHVMARILRYGLPAGATATVSALSFMVFSLVLTGYDEMSTTAANAVFRINNVFYMILCAISDATLILAGRHHGSGEDDVARQIHRTGIAMMFIALAACYSVIISGAAMFLDCFRGVDATYASGDYHRLGFALICMMLLREAGEGVIFITSAALRGVGDTRFVMFAQCGCDLALWTPFVLSVGANRMPLTTLWISMPLNMMVIATLLVFRWRSRRWQTHRLTKASETTRSPELAH